MREERTREEERFERDATAEMEAEGEKRAAPGAGEEGPGQGGPGSRRATALPSRGHTQRAF
jgi:hypothetical protein